MLFTIYDSLLTLHLKAAVEGREQFPVAQRIVNTGDIDPELVVTDAVNRIGCLLAAVRMFPLPYYLIFGMWSVDEHIVVFRGCARLNLLNLVPNSLHDSNEVVQLCLALAFSRLDHQRPVNGE